VRVTTAPLEGNVDEVEIMGQGVAPAAAGRHRLHRSPARSHAMKVLYGDDEWVLLVQAAQMLGCALVAWQRGGVEGGHTGT